MSSDHHVPFPSYPGFVYVLELEDDCFYVGYTADPETRISSHFLGRGAQWTALHKPLGVKCVQPGDTQLENCLTIALMCKFGFQKVRGGRFLDVNMTIAPPPIRHAFAIKPLTKISSVIAPETICGHNVVIQRIKGEESITAWRARITGPIADKECKKSGTKTLYAASEQELRLVLHDWLRTTPE
jgi:hypothetical protein